MCGIANKVLIVEDNDDWRSLLGLFVQRCATEVLHKPIDFITLPEVLRKYLSTETKQRWIGQSKNLSTGNPYE
jgi:hypothetical protein